MEIPCGDTMWRCHVEVPCGGTMWRCHLKIPCVEIPCGDAMWRYHMEIPYGDTLWRCHLSKYHVEIPCGDTMCGDTMWRDIQGFVCRHHERPRWLHTKRHNTPPALALTQINPFKSPFLSSVVCVSVLVCVRACGIKCM